MIPLRAGPVSLTFDDGDLRDLRVGDHEIVRRVYMVFQDLNWTARPWDVADVQARVGHDDFEISFTASGTFDATGFNWNGRLSGDADGTITYSVVGQASLPFTRNRLSLCVLHPLSAAGAECLVEHVDGSRQEGRFPVEISPHQPFLDVRSITHEFGSGDRTTVTMLGDTFEMEDHRNWSDATFKSYSPPIALPFPVEVTAGTTVEQSAIISVDLAQPVSPALVGAARNAGDEWVTLSLGQLGPALPLPRLGLQVANDDVELSPRQEAELRLLQLDHLRVDVDLSQLGSLGRLASGIDQARAIGARLVAALHATDARQLVAATDLLTAEQDVLDCCIVFDSAQKVSPASLARGAHASFSPDLRIGGGTNLYFTELNRQPPDTSVLDVVAFSLNPQVHASDDLSVMQNLEAQASIAADVKRLAGQAQVYVGPVTLRPRFNPNATRPDLDISNTTLPSAVDARQRTDFAAAWTIGSITQLASAGTIAAVTYFETTGWRGVMERDEGSQQPADFKSTPGATFPVYDALALFAGFTQARHCPSSDPRRIVAVVVEDASRRRLILANLTANPVTVRVDGPAGGGEHIQLPAYAHHHIDYGREPR